MTYPNISSCILQLSCSSPIHLVTAFGVCLLIIPDTILSHPIVTCTHLHHPCAQRTIEGLGNVAPHPRVFGYIKYFAAPHWWVSSSP